MQYSFYYKENFVASIRVTNSVETIKKEMRKFLCRIISSAAQMWHIITFLQHCHQKIFKQLSAVTLHYLLYLNIHSYEAYIMRILWFIFSSFSVKIQQPNCFIQIYLCLGSMTRLLNVISLPIIDGNFSRKLQTYICF